MTKKTVVHHKIEAEHYVADAFVVWCFDARFHGLLNKFIESQKWSADKIDFVKVAGGAKVFATPEVEYEETHYRSQIEKSIKLHHTKKIVLMAHANCGAYGKEFPNAAAEEQFYSGELKKAQSTVSEFLKSKKLELPVEIYYADFSGLHQIS